MLVAWVFVMMGHFSPVVMRLCRYQVFVETQRPLIYMPLPMSASNGLDTLDLEPFLGRHHHSAGLINDRPIPGPWDRPPAGVGGLQPCLLGSQNLL